ncbi:glycine receptor subunit alpha-4 [Elysia marginata]|uniref:Glycine receptor subunit alpha-4 n=1 Tax=Elysia marginata TaxID=1093978 RepID=A0AAV4FK41_9GAST|nr:glycine receptor subunit alpha-4 [Elysia marginata]
MLLNSVGPVSNLEMELTSSFYLRQEWLDPRLSFQTSKEVDEPISISIEYLPLLWKPDLFFTLGLTSYRHDSTTPNVFLRLWSNGTVLYSQRITSTMKCQMDLSNFPHDIQHCRSPMMSYSYTTKDLVFEWSSKRKATSVLPSAYLAEFVLSSVSVVDCTETFATGTFTCLESVLTLERQMGFYMTQTYIPSILIVMLSWAAFWIDHEAVPARISVGLLTVLTITTQSSGARSELPRVSYIKAIDVWMSANLVFVFAAYMEYAVVTITSRRYKRNLRNSGEVSAHAGNNITKRINMRCDNKQ